MRFAALVLLLLTAISAAAQSPPPSREAPRGDRQPQARGDRDAVAPGPSPQERGSLDSAEVRARLLADLFDKLKAASSAQEADAIDDAIEAIWARTGSPTVDLMMSWVAEEVARRNVGRARDYLDGILVLAPDHAEAYYRRGQIAFAQRDYAKAMADLERALAIEPRHYGALVGVGTILRDLQRYREALVAFRAALAIHPQLPVARRAVETLRPRVDGRDS